MNAQDVAELPVEVTDEVIHVTTGRTAIASNLRSILAREPRVMAAIARFQYASDQRKNLPLVKAYENLATQSQATHATLQIVVNELAAMHRILEASPLPMTAHWWYSAVLRQFADANDDISWTAAWAAAVPQIKGLIYVMESTPPKINNARTAANNLIKCAEEWRKNDPNTVQICIDPIRGGINPGPAFDSDDLLAIGALGPTAAAMSEKLRAWSFTRGQDGESRTFEPLDAVGFLTSITLVGPEETLKKWSISNHSTTPDINEAGLSPVINCKKSPLMTQLASKRTGKQRRPGEALLKILAFLFSADKAWPDAGIAAKAGIGLPTARRPLQEIREYLNEEEAGWRLNAKGIVYARKTLKKWNFSSPK